MLTVENFGEFGELTFDSPRFYPPKLCTLPKVMKNDAHDFVILNLYS